MLSWKVPRAIATPEDCMRSIWLTLAIIESVLRARGGERQRERERVRVMRVMMTRGSHESIIIGWYMGSICAVHG